jgi:hypothetical protein
MNRKVSESESRATNGLRYFKYIINAFEIRQFLAAHMLTYKLEL